MDLKPGRKYRFTLTSGAVLEGELRTTAFPRGYAGANPTGERTIWITSRMGFEHFLRPDEIVEAEEIDEYQN